MAVDKFNVASYNTFKIDPNKKGLLFVVNDVGSSGGARFRYLVERGNRVEQLIFVDLHQKVSDAKSVYNQVTKLISLRLQGAQVQYMSSLPDLRPPVEKAKIDKNSMRLRYQDHTIKTVSDISVSIENLHVDLMKPTGLYGHVEKEEVLNVDELKSSPVAYMIRRRTRKAYFDSVTSHRDAIISNHRVMSLSVHLGLLDDLIKDSKLRVLLLTEGQHDALTKKGVKLIAVRDHLSAKIDALEKTEKFLAKVERAVSLSKITHLHNALQFSQYARVKVTEEWVGEESPFKQLTLEYHVVKNQATALCDVFAKATLYFNLCGYVDLGEKTTKQINSQLEKRYPMLKMINYNSLQRTPDTFKTLIAYVEQIDSLLATVVKKVQEEVDSTEVFTVEAA